MLALRHLHSAQCRRKNRLLVKDIVETYDFNGYKARVKFESHPFYTNYIVKYKHLQKDPGKKLNDSQVSKDEGTDVNGNQKLAGSPNFKLKEIERLSFYISEKSLLAHQDSAMMPYSNFMESYYAKNLVQKERKKINKPPAVIPFSAKCGYCQRTFKSSPELSKHKILCKTQKMKSAAVKTFAKNLVKKVRKGKIEKPPRVLYPCSICTDRFMSKSALESHLKYDHRPRPTCEKCMKMFDCRRKLVDHEKVCASLLDGVPSVKQTLGVIDFKATKELHICIKCENPFTSSDDLQQHKILLNKRNPLDIEITSETPNIPQKKIEIFIKKKPFYFEIKQPNPYVNNSCSKCGKSFRNQMRLNQHFGFCHEKTQKCCPFCLKKFRGVYHRNQHIDFCTARNKTMPSNSLVRVATDHAPTGEETYQCCLCDVKFQSLSQLNQHLKTTHNQYYCPNCVQVSHNFIIKYLAAHYCVARQKLVFTTAKNVPYSGLCYDCSKKIIVRAFKKPFVHQCPSSEADSDGESVLVTKRYKCQSCKSCFESKQQLLLHQQKVSKMFQCTICPCMTFSKKLHMRRHMRNKHNVIYCVKCQKTYAKSMKHTCGGSMTSSSCYICGPNWSGSNILEHLAIIHSRLYPFTCDRCDNVFKLAASLQKHYKLKHGKGLIVDHTKETFLEKHRIRFCKECQVPHILQKSVNTHSCSKQSIKKKRKGRRKSIAGNLNRRDVYSDGFCYLCRCRSSLLAKYKLETGDEEMLCQFCCDGLPLSCDGDNNPPLEFVKSPVKDIRTFTKATNSTNSSNQKFDSIDDDVTTIKPVGPSFEACLNSENDVCESSETSAVLTLKEAEESLKSLLVDGIDVNRAPTVCKHTVAQPCVEENRLLDVLLTQKHIPVTFVSEPDQAEPAQFSGINSDLDSVEPQNRVYQSNVLSGLTASDKDTAYVGPTTRSNMVGEASLLDEIKIVESFRIFPCKFCNINFDSERSVDLHVDHQHNGITAETTHQSQDSSKKSDLDATKFTNEKKNFSQLTNQNRDLIKGTNQNVDIIAQTNVDSNENDGVVELTDRNVVNAFVVKLTNQVVDVCKQTDQSSSVPDKQVSISSDTTASSEMFNKTSNRFETNVNGRPTFCNTATKATAVRNGYTKLSCDKAVCNGYTKLSSDKPSNREHEYNPYFIDGSRTSIGRKKKERCKPYDREQVLLEKMLRKTNERPDMKTLRQPKASVPPTDTDILRNGIGSEYNNGISNYFNDIMRRSNSQNRQSDYLSTLRHRIRTQFESEGRWKPPSCEDNKRHSHLRRKSADSAKHLKNQSDVTFAGRHVNNHKENVGKPKLLFNQKNLDELRKKIRRKSAEQTRVETLNDEPHNDLSAMSSQDKSIGDTRCETIKKHQEECLMSTRHQPPPSGNPKTEDGPFSFLEDY